MRTCLQPLMACQRYILSSGGRMAARFHASWNVFYCSHIHLDLWEAKEPLNKWDGDLHQVSAALCLAAFTDYIFLRRLKSLMQSLQEMQCRFLLSGKCQSWCTAYWFPAMPDWIYIFPVLSHIYTKHTKAGREGRMSGLWQAEGDKGKRGTEEMSGDSFCLGFLTSELENAMK